MVDTELFNKGNDLYDKGKIKESLSMYNQSLAINPNNEKALYNRGVCLRDMFLYHQALDCYNLLISKNPLYAKAYKQKGCCLLDLGERQGALEAFEKAISLEPKNELFHYYKGVTLYELGKFPEAIKSFDIVLASQPNFIEAYNRKANCYFSMEDMENSIQCYEKALKYDKNPYIIYNKGNCLYHLGKKKEALDCYNEAISLKSDFGRAFNGKGRCLEDFNEFEEAQKCYEKGIKLLPNDEIILLNLGNCLRKQKKFDEANKSYDRIIKLYPNFSEAYFNKGVCFLKEEKYEESVAMLTYALSLYQKDEEYYLYKAQALLKLEKYEEAVKCLDELIAFNPDVIESYLLISKAYEGMGQPEKVKEYIEKANNLKPDNLGVGPIRSSKKRPSVLRKKSDSVQESSDTYMRKEKMKTYIIPSTSLVEKKIIFGSGSYGTVYFSVYKEIKVAIKKVKFSSIEKADSVFSELMNEMPVLVKLHHQNVLSYIGISRKENSNSISIVSQRCNGGDLASFLSRAREKSGEVSKELVMNIITQISEGIQYLNNPDPIIILGNLKPSNIFFLNEVELSENNEKVIVKVGDYEIEKTILASKFSDKESKIVSISSYLAPEVAKGEKPTVKSDIYSLGVIIYELITLGNPYKDVNNSYDLMNSIINGKGVFNFEHQNFKNYHQDYVNLINECVQTEPEKRPEISAFVEKIKSINNVK